MEPASADSSQPALVRSTEDGTFFRGPLANALRAFGVLGALPSLGMLAVALRMDGDGMPPMLFLSLACGVAAWLAAQVLFARARRIGATAGVRFPVVPAVRECGRALAEAGFVWAMTLGTAGVVGFLWGSPEVGERQVMTAFGAGVVLALLGWIGLLMTHVSSELWTALVEIANNTHAGEDDHVA